MYFLDDLPQRLDSGASPTFARVLVGDGGYALPSVAFAGAPGTGLWYFGTNKLGIATNGLSTIYFGRDANGGYMQGASGSAGYIDLYDAGAVGLVAAGTNQNIYLAPSGTGIVQIGPQNGAELKLVCATDSAYRVRIVSAYNASAAFQLFGVSDVEIFRHNTGTNSFSLFPGVSGNSFLINTATNSSNGALQIATHTTAGGGIGLGAEWSIYRVDATALRFYTTNATCKIYLTNSTKDFAIQISGSDCYLDAPSAGGVYIRTGGAANAAFFDSAQNANFYGFLKRAGQARVTSQFNKTSDITLANIPGLSVNVAAAGNYYFRAVLILTCNASGGSKVAIAGTATATTINYSGCAWSAAAIGAASNATALGTAVAAATAAHVCCEIEGTIQVNAAGTLTVQFAQNASFATQSSVLVGSTFDVQAIA